MSQGVVIIGAGHAGGACAAFLRQYGYDQPITLLGAEPYAPYQRPPLSKAWLKGEAGGDDLALKAEDFYLSQAIDLKTRAPVYAIHREEKKVILGDGVEIFYDYLIIATGSKARPFGVKGAEKASYLNLRTLDDAQILKQYLTKIKSLGIVGAGYVGLEVAATAVQLGCRVTIFERENHILSRVASKALSDFYTQKHTQKGVDIRCDTQISEIGELSHGQTYLSLNNGQTYDFDTVLAGIGALPADELAQKAGLDCANGIVVDTQARTSDPNIFAIGDVTSRTLPFYSGRFRLESVPNALEQAKQAAAAITGAKPPVVDVPWFWSDQYDSKLQIAGLNKETVTTIIRGDPAKDSFSVLHLDGQNRLRCAECVNSAADFMAAKLLIAKGTVLPNSSLVHIETPLKSYISKPA